MSEAQEKTVHQSRVEKFALTEVGQKKLAARILELDKQGWKVTNKVTVRGKYRGGSGCLLAFIFLPLALLAGHDQDSELVTFERDVTEAVAKSAKESSFEKQKINWAWAFGLLFVLVSLANFSKSLLAGTLYLVPALLLIPPVLARVNARLKKPLAAGWRIAIIIFSTLAALSVTSYIDRPPALVVESPQEGASIQAPSVTVRGTVIPSRANVTVNGGIALVADDGSFNYVVALRDESNVLTVRATNGASVATATVKVMRIFSDEEKAERARLQAEEEAQLQAKRALEQKEIKEAAARALVEQKAFDATRAGKICQNNPGWSKIECQDIADHKYWIGMDLDMLKASYGSDPDYANPSNYGSGTQWQWCWTSMTPSCFYGGDDGIIESYN